MASSEGMKSGVAHAPDGVAISYSIQGDGATALVFVHGWCGEQWHWREQISPFSADYAVVTLDLAGHGLSGSNRSDWTIEAFANDVAAVVRHLKLQRIVLIGHSLGGSVVAEASAILKDETIALIGVDTWSSLKPQAGGGDDQSQRLADLRNDFGVYVDQWIRRMFPPTADTHLVDCVVKAMARHDPEMAIAAMMGGGRHTATLQRRMRELGAPSYLIASQGSLFPKDAEVARKYGIGFVEMPDVGHFLMLEAPAPFNALLRNALLQVLA